jgi:DNA-binding LytR/AlgR family response regulator|nr:LytTR family DNA-binding domain-containing protein [uncultured Emticicia sp.]
MKTEIKVGGRMKLFSEDVAYFEADVNYTIIHYYQGKNKIVATTIGQIHERIGEECGFIRPNRGYLINLQFVDKYKLGELLLQNKLKVNISRRRKKRLNNIVEKYFEQKIQITAYTMKKSMRY